jgi:hypothetical protein
VSAPGSTNRWLSTSQLAAAATCLRPPRQTPARNHKLATPFLGSENFVCHNRPTAGVLPLGHLGRLVAAATYLRYQLIARATYLRFAVIRRLGSVTKLEFTAGYNHSKTSATVCARCICRARPLRSWWHRFWPWGQFSEKTTLRSRPLNCLKVAMRSCCSRPTTMPGAMPILRANDSIFAVVNGR